MHIPGIDVLGCQSVYSWLWVSKISEMVFFQMLYLIVMSWRFMIAYSIFSMVLCGVKEFDCNSFKISVLKGVSQSWLSLWRMHNLRDASWEHSDILWSVPHWTLWFMIASSIFSMVLCGVKEFGFNSFEISVLKGVSQSWLSLWRMHNLRDASWEHSDILWCVPHCGHFDSWLHPQYSLWCYVVSKNLVATVSKFQFWKG